MGGSDPCASSLGLEDHLEGAPALGGVPTRGGLTQRRSRISGSAPSARGGANRPHGADGPAETSSALARRVYCDPTVKFAAYQCKAESVAGGSQCKTGLAPVFGHSRKLWMNWAGGVHGDEKKQKRRHFTPEYKAEVDDGVCLPSASAESLRKKPEAHIQVRAADAALHSSAHRDVTLPPLGGHAG